MDAKVVCVLCVLACAVLTSYAVPVSELAYEMDAISEMAHMLERAIDSVGDRLVNDDDDDVIGYNNGDEDAETVLSRRRRMIGGMHRKVGGAYRGRPRPAVFRPRWRSGRTRSRQNTSPY